jgi:ribose transport system substrate-binding protein
MNGPMKMAMKNKFPLLDIDYPPAMMGTALDVALQVLSGASVPCIYTINSTIALTHGDETPSIPHPDMYVDQHVVGAVGMGPGYNPTTFKIDFPH